MRTTSFLCAALAALALSCGKTAPSTSAEPDASPPPTIVPAPRTDAEIRIRGVRVDRWSDFRHYPTDPGFDLALLHVAGVVVRCDDAPLPTRDGQVAVDLSNLDQAFLLARFDVPAAGCGAIRVAITFGGCGSYSTTATDLTAPIDVRGLPIQFAFAPSDLDPVRRHAVLEIDLARSIDSIDGIPSGSVRDAMFLPTFQVVF